MSILPAVRQTMLGPVASLSLLALAASGCYYRQLRCVPCRHHTTADTVRYAAGGLQSTRRRTSIGAGLHGNHRHVVRTREFDTTGRLTRRAREAYISTYKDFGKIMLRSAATEYRFPSDSIRKKVEVYRKGKLARLTVVNK